MSSGLPPASRRRPLSGRSDREIRPSPHRFLDVVTLLEDHGQVAVFVPFLPRGRPSAHDGPHVEYARVDAAPPYLIGTEEKDIFLGSRDRACRGPSSSKPQCTPPDHRMGVSVEVVVVFLAEPGPRLGQASVSSEPAPLLRRRLWRTLLFGRFPLHLTFLRAHRRGCSSTPLPRLILITLKAASDLRATFGMLISAMRSILRSGLLLHESRRMS